MSPLRLLARPLLAAPFVATGLDHLRHPGPVTEAAGPHLDRLGRRLGRSVDTQTAVRANGAVMAVAAALFATGRLRRLSATVMALTLVPVSSLDAPFWTEKDPEARRARFRLLLRDAGLLGAALLAVVGPGDPRDRARRTRRTG